MHIRIAIAATGVRLGAGALLAALMALGLAGCDRDEGPAEETAEAVEEQAEDAGEVVEDAAEETQDTAEEAAEEVDEAVDGN